MPTPGTTVLLAAFVATLAIVALAHTLCLGHRPPVEEGFDNPGLATTPSKDTGAPRASELPSYPAGPTYDPAKYNTDPYIQNSHNCYAYSLDVYDPALADQCKTVLTSAKNATRSWTGGLVRRPKSCFHLRPKPGRISNTHQDLPYEQRMTCKRMLDGILQDIPTATVVQRDEKCKPGYYKIAYAIDPGRTYHFYRQDEDGGWSHKDAWRAATRLDASGARITDPATADRKYRHTDLKHFCHYVCVPLQTVRPTLLK